MLGVGVYPVEYSWALKAFGVRYVADRYGERSLPEGASRLMCNLAKILLANFTQNCYTKKSVGAIPPFGLSLYSFYDFGGDIFCRISSP